MSVAENLQNAPDVDQDEPITSRVPCPDNQCPTCGNLFGAVAEPFNVLIVSAPDLAVPRSMVLEIVHKRSAQYATERATVVTVDADDQHPIAEQTLREADLLVGIFPKSGTTSSPMLEQLGQVKAPAVICMHEPSGDSGIIKLVNYTWDRAARDQEAILFSFTDLPDFQIEFRLALPLPTLRSARQATRGNLKVSGWPERLSDRVS